MLEIRGDPKYNQYTAINTEIIGTTKEEKTGMTIEERIAAIDAAIGHGQLMTDDIVHKGSLQNKVICGCRTGYKFKMNNLSYRGVWISTLENISLKVDGEEVSHKDMSIQLRDFLCNVDETGNNTDVFWAAKDECWIIVNKVGGLSAGDHTLEIEVTKRNDFGHSFGEGEEGYAENAHEFLNPAVGKQTIVCTVKEA